MAESRGSAVRAVTVTFTGKAFGPRGMGPTDASTKQATFKPATLNCAGPHGQEASASTTIPLLQML